MLHSWLEDGIHLFDSYNISSDNDFIYLQGIYDLNVEVNRKIYQYKFDILIVMNIHKQKEIPKVYLQNITIPAKFEHVYRQNNNLCCLGLNYEIINAWGERTFLNFLQRILNPYLVNFLEFKKNQQYIDGDRAHALKGVLDYYSQYFVEVSEIQLIYILQYCYNKIKKKENSKGHNLCPCKNGKKIRDCIHNIDIQNFINITVQNQELKYAFLKDCENYFSIRKEKR